MDEHQKNQAIAEEIAEALEEPENIGLFYKLAITEHHQFLREILSWLKDYPNPLSKGRLFFWRLKQLRINKSAEPTTLINEGGKEKIEHMKKGLKLGFDK